MLLSPALGVTESKDAFTCVFKEDVDHTGEVRVFGFVKGIDVDIKRRGRGHVLLSPALGVTESEGVFTCVFKEDLVEIVDHTGEVRMFGCEF